MSSRIKMPERLELPREFPAANDVRGLGEAGKDQKQWWYDARRVLQLAIEGLRGQRNKFETAAAAGNNAASLGNGPVNGGTPHAWVEVVAPDGTACVMPMWKKS